MLRSNRKWFQEKPLSFSHTRPYRKPTQVGEMSILWRLSAYENVQGRNKNIAVIGFTPVLRYQSDSKLGLYGEIGVGVNLLSTLYKNEDKELSTAFQFGDHIGVGYTTAKWDFGLRFQHYSNASIKSPNAGANWVVAKAAYRF
jgi:lipid A 3-O-deacylase